MLLIKLRNNRRLGFIYKTSTYFKKKINGFYNKNKNVFHSKKNHMLVKLTFNSVIDFTYSLRRKNVVHIVSDGNSISKYNLQHGYNNLQTNKYSGYYWRKCMNYGYVLSTSITTGVFIKNIYDFYKGNIIFTASGGNYTYITSFNKDMNTLSIKLPSGKVKKISIFSLFVLGRGFGIFNKYRYHLYFKFNPQKKFLVVRGIAKNPVDHPNGGRSNTKKPFMNKYNNLAKYNK